MEYLKHNIDLRLELTVCKITASFLLLRVQLYVCVYVDVYINKVLILKK